MPRGWARFAKSYQKYPTIIVITAHGGASLNATALEDRSASVLIVDRFEESRDALRTILEVRGVNILEAKQGDRGLKLLREHHPDVVVLDLEVDDDESSALREAYEGESRRNASSLVMLGKVKGTGRSVGAEQQLDTHCVIAKPYHYGPLIRTIEELLVKHKDSAHKDSGDCQTSSHGISVRNSRQ